jgi:hypothetical protein
MKAAATTCIKEATTPRSAAARRPSRQAKVWNLPAKSEGRPQTNAQSQTNNLIDFRKHHHTFRLFNTRSFFVRSLSFSPEFNCPSYLHQSSVAYGE